MVESFRATPAHFPSTKLAVCECTRRRSAQVIGLIVDSTLTAGVDTVSVAKPYSPKNDVIAGFHYAVDNGEVKRIPAIPGILRRPNYCRARTPPVPPFP